MFAHQQTDAVGAKVGWGGAGSVHDRLPCATAPTPPFVTFRRVAASFRGPGQSVLPFACCVGSMLSEPPRPPAPGAAAQMCCDSLSPAWHCLWDEAETRLNRSRMQPDFQWIMLLLFVCWHGKGQKQPLGAEGQRSHSHLPKILFPSILSTMSS